tara:strand:+ start:481 stop:1308 length:828 start_codon:yes stop_codon:yes gene_type:complete
MADYGFSASETAHSSGQIEGTIPAGANDAKYVQSVNTNWSTAKGGTGTIAHFTGTSYAYADLDTPDYRVGRGYILFELPENLVRLDEVPQLSLHVSVGVALVAPSVICSNAMTPATPLHSEDAQSLFQNTQTASSAVYNANTGTSTYGQYNTYDLNQLAAYHCITQRYIIISVINKTYDYDNVAPTGNFTAIPNAMLAWQGAGHSSPPKLILRSPWFKNSSTGQAQKYKGDYVINAHDPDLNQYDKRVSQVPFGLNIKGPISLRGTDNAYKTTRK